LTHTSGRVDQAASVRLPRHDAHYIGGRWTQPHGGGTTVVVDPSTEQVLAEVSLGDAADVDAAVRAAGQAFPAWSGTSPDDRAAFLRDLATAMRDRSEELAALIAAEVGSPITFARGTQVGLPVQVLDGMSELVGSFQWEHFVGPSIVVREAAGIAGAITPWNYPLHQLTAKVAAALGAGCTVVAKPSEVAPLSALAFAEIVDHVGLPPGVFNLVNGDGPVVGEAIAGHPGIDVVSFTGSLRAGRTVMRLAAETTKKVALELGGKSACVVLDDVDVPKVVRQAIVQALRNSGQNCSALSRLLVPYGQLQEAEQAAAEAARAVRLGHPFDPSADMGPLVSGLQRDRVRRHVTRAVAAGARIIAGGTGAPDGLDRGYFFQPTVLGDVRPEMEVAQEEIFGPVVCLIPYRDDDDAVAIANDSRYGLAGAVWSGDRDRAMAVARRMRTGRVVVNGGAFNPIAPFGGYRQSGIGRELGRYGLEEYLEVKTLQC
jgi:acyl-CoA reductase-like NAD-dependent aldehyde dehydrogenase